MMSLSEAFHRLRGRTDIEKKPKNVNFADRNAVEDFLHTERFRSSCDNLHCDKIALPTMTLYMPVCLQNRFARDDVAQHFDMPDRSKPVSPVTYSMIPLWAPHISCPPSVAVIGIARSPSA